VKLDEDYSASASEENTDAEPGSELDETLDGELAEDGESETEEESEESAETTGDTAKRLKSLEKALLDTKRELTKVSMERAELRGKLEGVTQRDTKAEADSDWLSEIDADEVRTDPHLLVNAIKRFRDEVVDVMRANNQWMSNQLKEKDPEMVAMRERMMALKDDPDYGKLSDDALLVIAKKQAAEERTRAKETRRAPARPGEGSSVSRRGSDKSDVRKTSMFKAIYPEFVEEKK